MDSIEQGIDLAEGSLDVDSDGADHIDCSESEIELVLKTRR